MLSGIHPDLPFGELRAIIQTFDKGASVEKISDGACTAETSIEVAKLAVDRSAYTKEAALLISSANSLDDLIDRIDPGKISELLVDGDTFEARVVRKGCKSIDRMQIEPMLGDIIMGCGRKLKVDLRNPNKRFILLATKEHMLFGLSIYRMEKKGLHERRAGSRPFSLPSALQPDISRCMVNLSRTKLGSRILDPFAGTASILIEAWLLGYDALGIEIKPWICSGALKNIKAYTDSIPSIVNGDASYIPFRRCFESIVTDPPYGRSTTISTGSFRSLLENFFSSIDDVLEEDGKICMAAPSDADTESIASMHGWKLLESYSVRVHGTLTRKIMVFIKR